MGRKAVASIVRITVRALLGSWKGMTTAAKVVRNWQVRGFHDADNVMHAHIIEVYYAERTVQYQMAILYP